MSKCLLNLNPVNPDTLRSDT